MKCSHCGQSKCKWEPPSNWRSLTKEEVTRKYLREAYHIGWALEYIDRCAIDARDFWEKRLEDMREEVVIP